MASFYAFDFIYDDIPSQKFDLKIVNFGDGGLIPGVGSSDVKLLTQRVLRKSKPYYLGRTQEPVLEFPLTFASPNILSALDRDLISKWLFGRAEYKKLYILQDDLNSAYFNCFLTSPQPMYVGSMNYAFQCTVTCDSPFAYNMEKTFSGSKAGGNDDMAFTIYNESSEDDYLYPTVYFLENSNEQDFILTNTTDSSRVFRFSNLSEGVEATVNNDLQMITSGTSGLLAKFNKNWFRLVPGNNELLFNGSVSTFTITYTERLKIGG